MVLIGLIPVLIMAGVAILLFCLYKLITRNDIVCHSLCAITAMVGIILCYTVCKDNLRDNLLISGICAFLWAVFTFNGTESEVTITEYMGGWYHVVEESGLSIKCSIVFGCVGATCLLSWLFSPWGAGVILGLKMAFNLVTLIVGIVNLIKERY
ncbi:MAG: hypothetical protein HDT36_02460 [Clostridiales bacterium]|nr:hypothetical protein [Clostridiales bacterium]